MIQDFAEYYMFFILFTMHRTLQFINVQYCDELKVAKVMHLGYLYNISKIGIVSINFSMLLFHIIFKTSQRLREICLFRCVWYT